MGSTGDMIDRIQGAAKALAGMRDKVDPPAAPASGAPVEPPPPPVVRPKEEDMEEADRILANLKGQVDALDAAVKDRKEKEKAAMEAAAASAAEKTAAHKSESGAHPSTTPAASQAQGSQVRK